MNGRIARVLRQQTAKNVTSDFGLARSNKGRAQGEEQSWIVRWIFKKWAQNFCCLNKVVSRKIAETQQLAYEDIIGSASELTFQRRNSVGIKFGTIAGQSPVPVESWKVALPCRSLLKVFRGLIELGSLGAHDAEIIVGAGENLRCERAIFFRGLGFCYWSRHRSCLGREILLHASLRHRFRGFFLVLGSRFDQAVDAVGSVAIAVGRDGGVLEKCMSVYAQLCFSVATRDI